MFFGSSGKYLNQVVMIEIYIMYDNYTMVFIALLQKICQFKKNPPHSMGTKKSPPQSMGTKKSIPLWGVMFRPVM